MVQVSRLHGHVASLVFCAGIYALAEAQAPHIFYSVQKLVENIALP